MRLPVEVFDLFDLSILWIGDEPFALGVFDDAVNCWVELKCIPIFKVQIFMSALLEALFLYFCISFLIYFSIKCSLF